MSTYPDNTGWSGSCPGIDRQAEGETYDMPVVFTHADGRVISMDIHTAIGGEAADSSGQRIPGTEDAFVSMVDDAWEDYQDWALATDQPFPNPTRRFWIYDTSVSYGAGTDKDHLVFIDELEESDTFVIDLDHEGAWQHMPQEVVTDVLTRQSKRIVSTTLAHVNVDEIYRAILAKTRP